MKFYNSLRINFLACVLFIATLSNAQYFMAGGPKSNIGSDLGNISLAGENSSITILATCPGTLGVEDLSSKLSADLISGNEYQIEVDFNSCGLNSYNVAEMWIDFNRNKKFEGRESIGSWTGNTPSGTQTFKFNVPTTCDNGTTHLRIIQREGGKLPLNPHASFLNGSVIDAQILLSGGTSQVFGCTDSLSSNYNPLATIDDGSCIYLGESGSNDYDCIDATVICQDYHVPLTYPDSLGNDPNEINSSNTCLSSGEYGSSNWYQFTSYENGFLGFTIIPDPNAPFALDYDWAVWDITTNGCGGIYSGASPVISCNYSGTGGATGPNGQGTSHSEGAGGPPFNLLMPVDSGSTYVINVGNYSANGYGYDIEFDTNGVISASTVDAIDLTVNCGDQVILDANFDGAITDSLFYSWSPASYLNDSTLEHPETIPMDSTQDFIVTVQNGDCILEDTLTVEITYADFTTLYDTSLCFGIDYTIIPEFDEDIDPDNLVFNWSPNINIDNINDSTPTVYTTDTIMYYVEIINGICVEYDSVVLSVTDSLAASAEYYINDNIEIDGVAEVEFYNQSTGSYPTYLWNYGDGDTSILFEEFHIYEDVGTYSVSLIVEDTIGCVDTLNIEVPIPLLEIPNIITPNGDGVNDVLSIKRLRPLSNLKIYNRWGKLVYDGLDYQNDWDGEGLEDGTYYVELTNQAGSELTENKSWFMIVR